MLVKWAPDQFKDLSDVMWMKDKSQYLVKIMVWLTSHEYEKKRNTKYMVICSQNTCKYVWHEDGYFFCQFKMIATYVITVLCAIYC